MSDTNPPALFAAGAATLEAPTPATQTKPQASAADHQYDVAIIGAGPGGYVAALRGRQLGLRVALVDKGAPGGACLNVGCIPTKAMLASVEAYGTAKRGQEFGFSAGEVTPDYPAMVKRRDRIVAQLGAGLQHLLKKAGVDLISGRARFQTAHSLEVESDAGSAEVTAGSIIVATGSHPSMPPIPGADLDGVVDSDALLALESVPARLAVVGAGAVGLEWGQIFHELGAKVELFEMVDQLLPPADADIAAELRRIFERRGLGVHCSAMVKSIEAEEGVLVLNYSTPQEGGQTTAAEVVLIATGRRPNTAGLGLEEIGVALKRDAVPVNERMQTSVASVYAIGDVVSGPQLAHVATREGEVAIENIAGHQARIDYSAMPAAVYTQPGIAWVGLTEAEAREERGDVTVGSFPFRNLGKALADGHREGFVKVVASERFGEILGVHMIGHGVTDLVAEATLAMTSECTLDEIIATVHAHPTLSEALQEAALDALGRALHKG